MSSESLRLFAVFDGLKNQGNRLFSAGKFTAAVDSYTEAIALIPAALSPPVLSSSEGASGPIHRSEGASNPYNARANSRNSEDVDAKVLRTLISVLYSNRALCYKALERWGDVEVDAHNAVILDRFNPKAHYLLGCCLCRKGEYENGIRSLEKGEDMAKRQKRPASLLQEFKTAIAVGRYDWHRAAVAQDGEQDTVLLSALESVVTTVRDSALAKAMQDAAIAMSESESIPSEFGASMAGLRSRSVRYSVVVPSSMEGSMPDVSEDPSAGSSRYNTAMDGDLDPDGDVMYVSSAPPYEPPGKPTYGAEPPRSAPHTVEEELAGKVEIIEQRSRELLVQLNDIFQEREARRRSRDVPSHFVCSITFEVMLDPVIAPSGHTYERAAIEKYVTDIKQEDPQTRQALGISQLVPNLALKAAIQAWLAENPWANPLVPPEKRDD